MDEGLPQWHGEGALAPALAPWTAETLDSAAAEFSQALNGPWPASTATTVDRLAAQIEAWMADAGPAGGRCDFSVELPQLGLLQGEVITVRGQAQVELRASRAAGASFLASRRQELQQALQQRTGGDVTLAIIEDA